MPWIFGSFLVTQCALTSCHIVISKQGSTIRALGSNRCLTGRRPRDKNHAVRFRRSAENRSQTRDTQPIRGVSDELASVCKSWHLLALGRRYEKKKSSLWLYVSPPHRNINPFENKVWEIYFYKEVCSFVHWNSWIMFDYVSTSICMRVYNLMARL